MSGSRSDPDFLCEVFATAIEAGAAKPDRAIFSEACDRLGTTPERVLHVGDTLVDDYEGAGQAGLHALLVHRTSESAPAGADVINDLRQVLPRLRIA